MPYEQTPRPTDEQPETEKKPFFKRKIGQWTAVGFVGLAIIGIATGGGGDEKAKAEKAPPKTTEQVAKPQPKQESRSDRASEVERKTEAKEEDDEFAKTARKISREFHASFKPQRGWEAPSWYSIVDKSKGNRGFAHTLDVWDGSIEVYTDLYPDAEGKEFAKKVGAGVLSVAYPEGVCKVDVMGSDGSRLLEHESMGAGCQG